MRPRTRLRSARAHTLVEVLTALLIGAMILVAFLGVYNRMQRSVAAVTRNMGSSEPAEIIDRFARDVDRLLLPGDGVSLTIQTKQEKGYTLTRVVMQAMVADKQGQDQVLDKVVWQTAIDPGNTRMTLYRAHLGLNQEDRVLDRPRADVEKLYPFVPVCSGLSLFRVQIPQTDTLTDQWSSTALPQGLLVSVSMAEPVVSPLGLSEVAESDQLRRTLAVDRTRMIRFDVPQEPNAPGLGNDANGVGAAKSDASASQKQAGADRSSAPVSEKPRGESRAPRSPMPAR